EGCVDLRIEEQLNANLSDPDDRKEVAKSGVQPFRQARIDLRQTDRGLVLQPFEVGDIYPRETMEMRHFELFRSLGQPLGQSIYRAAVVGQQRINEADRENPGCRHGMAEFLLPCEGVLKVRLCLLGEAQQQ